MRVSELSESWIKREHIDEGRPSKSAIALSCGDRMTRQCTARTCTTSEPKTEMIEVWKKDESTQ